MKTTKGGGQTPAAKKTTVKGNSPVAKKVPGSGARVTKKASSVDQRQSLVSVASVMTVEEVAAKQKPFVDLVEEYLATHMVDGKKMTLRAFAQKAGLSEASVSAIMINQRWIARSTDDTIERFARILEIAPIQVFVLAGRYTIRDFVFHADGDETLNAIYRMAVRDKRMMGKVMTEGEWGKMTIEQKLSWCALYEAVIERRLLRWATL